VLGGTHPTTRVGPALFVATMVLFGAAATLLSPTVSAIVPEPLHGRYNGGYTLAWTGRFIAGPAAAGLALAAGQGQAPFARLTGVLSTPWNDQARQIRSLVIDDDSCHG